jgi:hypothetical protein
MGVRLMAQLGATAPTNSHGFTQGSILKMEIRKKEWL